jgi:DNA-directed RNA polymerase specialized sigma24 family protein
LGVDQSAFSALYERHFDRVYGYMAVTLGDPDEAAAAVEDVFATAYADPAGCDRDRLFELAQHRAMPCAPEADAEPAREPRYCGPLASIRDARLIAEIRRLPHMQREAVARRYVLGLATDDRLHRLALHAIERRLRKLRRGHVSSRRPSAVRRARTRRRAR